MKTRIALVGILLVTLSSLSGCGGLSDTFGDNGDTFEDRQEALNSVYQQGKSARSEMIKLGIVVSQQSCDNSWVTSGARDAEKNSSVTGVRTRSSDKNFQNLRHLSFINGCLDRPNRISPTSAPSLEPTPSASTSRHPTPKSSKLPSRHSSPSGR